MSLSFKLRQQLKMFSQNVYLPAVYNFHRFSNTDRNLIIFADAHHDSRPEAMELLARRLRRETVGGKFNQVRACGDDANGGGCLEGGAKYHIVEMYLDFSRASVRQVLEFSTRFMKLYARASVVVICDNFLPVASCRKKADTLVIQLWHACGCYKKFGYDAKDDIPEGYHGDVFRNMDLVTVSAEAAVEPFCLAMHKDSHRFGKDQGTIYYENLKDKEQDNREENTENDTRVHRGSPNKGIGCVEPLGVSRTDLYFSKKWQVNCRRNFYETYPEARGKKIVLWAPTFRGNAGIPELLNLDVEKLQQQLGPDYLVLTRIHPHMKETQKAQAHNCPIPTEQLYPVVDVLIADYSSLIYEYLLAARICGESSGREEAGIGTIQRGVVLYVPDLEEYESKRGFYMDIHEIPGEIVKKEEHLADAVRRAGEEKAASLDSFLSKYMSACDGHATERIAERIRSHCAES